LPEQRGLHGNPDLGFTDKYSWIGSHSRGARGQALPFDRAYQPKAAYRAVLEEILAGRSTRH